MAGLAIVLAFGWRASLVPVQADVAPPSGDGVAIPSLERVDEAAIVAAADDCKDLLLEFFEVTTILLVDDHQVG